MSASIATTSAYQFPDLADLSKTGARLTGAKLPPVGSTALLKAGALEVLCKIIWVRDGQCGLCFEEIVSHAVLNQVHREGAVHLKTDPQRLEKACQGA